MSFVVLVMRLATEKSCISSLPMSITWRKSFSRTVKLKLDAALAARYPQPTASTALAERAAKHFAPTDRISAVAPTFLMSVVRSVM